MINEQDLKEAIAECQGVRSPNANTCIKLAAYYTILNNLNKNQVEEYSFASPGESIKYSNSEFSHYVIDKGIERVFPVIDEMMEALSVVNPRLYSSTISRIERL